jgi:hypothetical protein
MNRSIIRFPLKDDGVQLTLKGNGVAIRVQMGRAVLADGYAIITGHLGIHCDKPGIYTEENPEQCVIFDRCYSGGGYFRRGTEVAEHWYRGEEQYAWSILEDWHRRQLGQE